MGQDEEREGSSVAIHRLLDGEQPPELETTGGCVLLKQTNQLLVWLSLDHLSETEM